MPGLPVWTDDDERQSWCRPGRSQPRGSPVTANRRRAHLNTPFNRAKVMPVDEWVSIEVEKHADAKVTQVVLNTSKSALL